MVVARLIRALTTISLMMLILLSAFSACTAQTQTPKYGGTFILTNVFEQKSLNPATIADDQALRLGQFGIYSPLVGMDYYYGSGEIYPMLAQTWDMSSDAKIFTFHLYENVSWHDGVKFTSADVLWTIQESIDKGGRWSGYFEEIETAEAPDEYTVRITLKSPNAGFLSLLGGYYSPLILPKHIYDGTDWTTNPANEDPVGTGPFKFQEWVRGSHTTLVAYNNYHLGRPYLDKIIFRAPVTYEASSAMLMTGEIHSMTMPTLADSIALQGDPLFNVYPRMAGHIIVHMTFNLDRAPFDNLLVRKAIAHAMNLTDIAYRVSQGVFRAAKGYYLQDSWAFNPDAAQPEYDPDLAEQLLDQAGFPRDPVTGIRFKTTLGGWQNAQVVPVVDVVKEYLNLIGIDLDVSVLAWPDYSAKVITRRDFDMAFLGGICGPDPVEFDKFVMTTGYRHVSGFNSSRIDELMILGKGVTDIDQRKEYYGEVQEILAENCPIVNIFEWDSPAIYSADFSGNPEDPSTLGRGYHRISFAKLYWKEGSDVSPASVMAKIESTEAELADLENRGYNVTAALNKLNDAKAAYAEGDYLDAYTKAEEALNLAIAPPEPPYLLFGGVIAAVIIVVFGGAYVYRRRKREV